MLAGCRVAEYLQLAVLHLQSQVTPHRSAAWRSFLLHCLLVLAILPRSPFIAIGKFLFAWHPSTAFCCLFLAPCRYGLAFGDSTQGNPFLSTPGGYAMKGWSDVTTPSGARGRWSDWFFQWAFAATAATIPAGAVAERFNFSAYLGEQQHGAWQQYMLGFEWVSSSMALVSLLCASSGCAAAPRLMASVALS